MSTIRQVLFFCYLFQGLVVWSSFGDSFMYQNPKEFCMTHFRGRIQGCAYTIRLYGQI